MGLARVRPLVLGPTPSEEGVHGHMTIKGSRADDARVTRTPVALKYPLRGGWELVHHLAMKPHPL